MNEFKGTPGPYSVAPGFEWGLINAADGHAIAHVHSDEFKRRPRTEAQATAHMLAASWEMFEALRAVPIVRFNSPGSYAWLQCVGCGNVADEDCNPECWVPKVEAAIAKALGEAAFT